MLVSYGAVALLIALAAGGGMVRLRRANYRYTRETTEALASIERLERAESSEISHPVHEPERSYKIQYTRHRHAAADAQQKYHEAFLLMMALLGAALVVGGAVAVGAALVVRRQNRLLDAQHEDTDAFAGRVAHDVKNALAPMILGAELLARRAPEPLVPYAQRIQARGKQLAGFVEALLAFARAGVRSDGTSPVREVLEGVALGFERGAPHIEVAPGLSARIAPALLESVAGNLLGNAVKYSGAREGGVAVRALRDGEVVVLSVEDHGVGMSEEVAARVFEPFYRAPDRPEPGFGLGLATVKRIVEAHGGTIAVASTPGEGTTFTVRLPAA
jgi:signal transduction histidine kinase